MEVSVMSYTQKLSDILNIFANLVTVWKNATKFAFLGDCTCKNVITGYIYFTFYKLCLRSFAFLYQEWNFSCQLI